MLRSNLHSSSLAALAALVALLASPLAQSAHAHGRAPHAQCKKGYVMTADNRCVKRP